MTQEPSKARKGVQDITPEDRAPSEKTQAAGCDLWGVRIATTLLTDFSDKERSELAEHIKSCSACATLVRQYEFIEESIRRLPAWLAEKATRSEKNVFCLKNEQRRSNNEEVTTFLRNYSADMASIDCSTTDDRRF